MQTGTYPTPAALAVVLHQERLLLVSRRNEPDAGLWGFPGGRIEWGETVFEAAARELAEETGVIAVPKGYLTTLDIIGGGDPASHHFVLTAVLCDYRSGTPRAADDARDAAWIGVADVLDGRLAMSENVPRLARLAAGR